MHPRFAEDTKLTDSLERELAERAVAAHAHAVAFNPLKALRRGFSAAVRARQHLRRMADKARVNYVNG